MQEIVSSFNDLISAIGVWLSINRDSILAGIISTVILGIIGKTIYFLLNKPKEIHELLRTNNFNDLDWIEELDKALEIKDTMKRNFPEYSDYLLIQYGSSVDANSKLPQDYDFIVLMLGFPKEGRRYLHNKGTGGLDDVSSKENKFDVDIVYRDYLATVYKGNIIKNLIMDCQSYTKYRPNETTGGIFVSWRRKEELPTGA